MGGKKTFFKNHISMKKFILLFANILIIVSCSKEDGIVGEALSNKKVSHTKKGVEDTDINSKSGTKVSICHKNAGEIVVDSAALATHMAHGDAVDMDGDGFYNIENPCSEGIDCDDSDSTVNPDATEVGYDGIDNDCNSLTLDDDLDEDGFIEADDCDDNNPLINPEVPETPYDGIDNDCNPLTLDDDLDEDGFVDANDCDDTNPEVNPGAVEICNNGIDDDCDGLIDYMDSDCVVGIKILDSPLYVYPTDLPGTYNWQEAVDACDDLISADGLDDWYLPNFYDEIKEVSSNKTLIEETSGVLFLDTPYWSYQSGSQYPSDGLAINMNTGVGFFANKTFYSYNCRCVRKD